MHIILDPSLFLERIDKLLSQWKSLKGRKLRIATDSRGRVSFQCDPQALDVPARIVKEGEVIVEAENALKALRVYSQISEIEIFTEGDVLVIKQRNFTMRLPCVSVDNLESFEDAVSVDRLVMLKLEKKRLQQELKFINKDIASLQRSCHIYKK